MWYHGIYRKWFLGVYSNRRVLIQIKKIEDDRLQQYLFFEMSGSRAEMEW